MSDIPKQVVFRKRKLEGNLTQFGDFNSCLHSSVRAMVRNCCSCDLGFMLFCGIVDDTSGLLFFNSYVPNQDCPTDLISSSRYSLKIWGYDHWFIHLVY